MAIFNQAEIDKEVASIKRKIESQHTQLRNTFLMLAGSVWNHRTFTPQQMLDGLGTEAATVFNLSSKTATLLYETTGEVINPIPEGYEFVVNEDGTITITAEPESSSESSASSESSEEVVVEPAAE